MGVHRNIASDRFPKQGESLGGRVLVFFQHDTARSIRGTIVRDDTEEPGLTIIRLDDGRHVLTSECQFLQGRG